jgi:hypothetical protein
MKRKVIIFFIMLALAICYCQNPTSTEEKRNGKVVMRNSSGVVIVISSYTHQRGSNSARQVLNRTLFPWSDYTFKTLLDPTQTYFFKGGDVVSVSYRSSESDPDDPKSPLFEGIAGATVNGNIGIVVKSGGHISVGPQ